MFTIKDEDRKISRLSYIIHAALEYFITILVTNTFLTNLLNNLKIDTATQGIIASFATFAFIGNVFSLIVVRRRTKMKRMVISLLVLDEICFALLYLVPIVKLPSNAKTIIFVILILLGYLFQNFASPFRSRWQMSNVAHNKRGEFTAIKEIVSLVTGFIFTMVMGRLIDKYEAEGNIEGSFIICGITCFVLTIFIFISLLLIKENETDEKDKFDTSIWQNLKSSLKSTTSISGLSPNSSSSFASFFLICFVAAEEVGDTIHRI